VSRRYKHLWNHPKKELEGGSAAVVDAPSRPKVGFQKRKTNQGGGEINGGKKPSSSNRGKFFHVAEVISHLNSKRDSQESLHAFASKSAEPPQGKDGTPSDPRTKPVFQKGSGQANQRGKAAGGRLEKSEEKMIMLTDKHLTLCGRVGGTRVWRGKVQRSQLSTGAEMRPMRCKRGIED